MLIRSSIINNKLLNNYGNWAITSLKFKNYATKTTTKSIPELIKVTENNGIREILLNDPKTRNSMSMNMMNELLDGITEGQKDKGLRCIVLSSTGTVFSAGHNLKELIPENGTDHHKRIFDKCTELMMSIIKSPVPIIAKIDGLAAAAGCQLIATCDLVVCTENSSFSTPGANFGIFCSTPGIAVARAVPRMQASHMLLTGLPINANDAYKFGLVSSVVPKDKLDAEVNKICEAIMSKSRDVIALGKNFFYQQITMDIATAYKHGGDVMTQNLRLYDGIEGIRSFIEKRKPNWNS